MISLILSWPYILTWEVVLNDTIVSHYLQSQLPTIYHIREYEMGNPDTEDLSTLTCRLLESVMKSSLPLSSIQDVNCPLSNLPMYTIHTHLLATL